MRRSLRNVRRSSKNATSYHSRNDRRSKPSQHTTKQGGLVSFSTIEKSKTVSNVTCQPSLSNSPPSNMKMHFKDLFNHRSRGGQSADQQDPSSDSQSQPDIRQYLRAREQEFHSSRPSNGLDDPQIAAYLRGRERNPNRVTTLSLPPPASWDVMSNLPRTRVLPTFRKTFKDDHTSCSVCCDRLVDGIMIVRLPCGHLFHMSCAYEWLSKTCTCPDCRYELETNVATYEQQRKERMKSRPVVTCSCKGRSHSCFFCDPTKSLTEQCQVLPPQEKCQVIPPSA